MRLQHLACLRYDSTTESWVRYQHWILSRHHETNYLKFFVRDDNVIFLVYIHIYIAYLLTESGISLANKNETKCNFYRCAWIYSARVEILDAFPTFSMFAWNVGKVYLNRYEFNYNMSRFKPRNTLIHLNLKIQQTSILIIFI